MAKEGLKKISATYEFAIHTHGSIGPSCAIAEFKDGKLTSWSASQATHNLRKQLAKMFDLPPENVRCIYVGGPLNKTYAEYRGIKTAFGLLAKADDLKRDKTAREACGAE